MNKRRSKGEGTVRKRVDGRWEGRFTDSFGEPQSIYAKTKMEVIEKLREITYIVSQTTYDKLGEDVKFDIWFEHYLKLKEHAVKQRTLHQIRLAYKNHIQPVLGDKRMFELNVNDIAIIYSRLNDSSREYSNKTKHTIIAHLKAMLNFAREEGVVRQIPVLPIKISNKLKSPRRALQPDEIALILNTAKNYDYKIFLMLLTLVCTGMRVGELCGIKWTDFKRDYQLLEINESRTDNRFENTTKSEDSERILPIPKPLAIDFQQYHRSNPNLEYGEHVFVNRVKNLYTSQNVEKRLHYITKMIYEQTGIDLTYVTPHFFRHTFVTTGLNSDEAIANMLSLTGHKKVETLMLYNHECTEGIIESSTNINKQLLIHTDAVVSDDDIKANNGLAS